MIPSSDSSLVFHFAAMLTGISAGSEAIAGRHERELRTILGAPSRA